MISGRQPSDYTRNIFSCSPADAVFISIQARSHQTPPAHTVVQSNPILCYQMCSPDSSALSFAARLRDSVTDHMNYVGNKRSFLSTGVKRWRRGFWLFIYLFINVPSSFQR
jgi:hypothetical protein